MHELGLAMSIVDAVCERAGGARIARVKVRVGALAAVLPDALDFAFGVATEGTLAAGARLEIAVVPGRARCRGCDAELALDRPFGRCECGRSDLEWLSGDELVIQEMELAADVETD